MQAPSLSQLPARILCLPLSFCASIPSSASVSMFFPNPLSFPLEMQPLIVGELKPEQYNMHPIKWVYIHIDTHTYTHTYTYSCTYRPAYTDKCTYVLYIIRAHAHIHIIVNIRLIFIHISAPANYREEEGRT